MTNGNPWWSNLPPKENDAKKTPKSTRGVITVVGTFGLILTTMVSFLVLGPDPQKPYESEFASTAYPSKTESLIAQCGDTFTFSPSSEHYGALPDDFFTDPETGFPVKRTIPLQPMSVPAYGYFVETNEENPVFAQEFYTLEDTRSIWKEEDGNNELLAGITPPEYLSHLWNGGKIIWYGPGIDDMTSDAIATYVAENEDVVALPWQKQMDIPGGRLFAFSAWNVTQSCGLWDSDVATEFMTFADEYNAGRKIENPPEAQLNSSGELSRINVKQHR